MLHMTNSHIVPYMVWNHSNLDLEWFYGPDPAQVKDGVGCSEIHFLQPAHLPCRIKLTVIRKK